MGCLLQNYIMNQFYSQFQYIVVVYSYLSKKSNFYVFQNIFEV